MNKPIVNKMDYKSNCKTELPLNTAFSPRKSENTPGFFHTPYPSVFGLNAGSEFQAEEPGSALPSQWDACTAVAAPRQQAGQAVTGLSLLRNQVGERKWP